MPTKKIKMFVQNYRIYDKPRGIVFLAMVTAFLIISPRLIFAQSTLEYMGLQGQVQGGQQQSTATEQPVYETPPSVQIVDQTNVLKQVTNFFSGIAKKFTPMQIVGALILLAFLWLSTRK